MGLYIKGINVREIKRGAVACLNIDDVVYFVNSDKIIPVHDHGDLIDRSMLIGGFADWYIQESPMYLGDSKVVAETIGDAMKAIEAAPVIIPAERSENDKT